MYLGEFINGLAVKVFDGDLLTANLSSIDGTESTATQQCLRSDETHIQIPVNIQYVGFRREVPSLKQDNNA